MVGCSEKKTGRLGGSVNDVRQINHSWCAHKARYGLHVSVPPHVGSHALTEPLPGALRAPNRRHTPEAGTSEDAFSHRLSTLQAPSRAVDGEPRDTL